MTTPLTPSGLQMDDANLDWSKRDKQRTELVTKQATQDKITPQAKSLGYDQYYNRLNQIQADSGAYTAGSVQADNYKKQYEATVKAQEEARQRQQAAYDAYQEMIKVQSGATFGQYGTYTIPGSGSTGGYDTNYDGTDAALADMMRAAGFSEADIGTGLAVVAGESGGRADATHPNPNGSIDQGLFQINSIHKARYAGQNIMDPWVNVQIAKQVFDEAGGSWSPWVVYQNGVTPKAVPASRRVAMQPYAADTGGSTGLRNAVVSNAMQYIGVPYVWGGESMSGVDCSGLVWAVYKNNGIQIGNRVSQYQAEEFSTGAKGYKTSINNLRPGDLFAWYGGEERGQYIGHIAIYAGNGEIIEAPQQGVPTRRRKLGSNENGFGIHVNFAGD